MAKRRQSGSIRRLPSGNFQARIRDAAGRMVPLGAFPTKADAGRAITLATADQTRGAWVDPRRGRIILAAYASDWVATRALRPRTRELYEGQLSNHILPTLGDIELRNLTPSAIRSWNGAMVASSRPGPVTTAKCYRLLKTILGTAVTDELLARNPCVVKGAGRESSPERPIASVVEINAIVAAIEPHWRALVLMATYCGLRIGELRGLTRLRLDLMHQTVAVVEQAQDLKDGSLYIDDPKSAAGVRTIAIPVAILPALEEHLAEYAAPGRDGLVFARPDGRPFRRATFYAAWRRAIGAVGRPELHLHDCRHSGNTLIAPTASLKELMRRNGWSSIEAALRYQHATAERDAAIARGLSDQITAASPPAAPVLELRPRAEGGR